MSYEKFIEYVLNGHEFMGFVCSHELKILNVIEGYFTTHNFSPPYNIRTYPLVLYIHINL